MEAIDFGAVPPAGVEEGECSRPGVFGADAAAAVGRGIGGEEAAFAFKAAFLAPLAAGGGDVSAGLGGARRGGCLIKAALLLLALGGDESIGDAAAIRRCGARPADGVAAHRSAGEAAGAVHQAGTWRLLWKPGMSLRLRVCPAAAAAWS